MAWLTQDVSAASESVDIWLAVVKASSLLAASSMRSSIGICTRTKSMLATERNSTNSRMCHPPYFAWISVPQYMLDRSHSVHSRLLFVIKAYLQRSRASDRPDSTRLVNHKLCVTSDSLPYPKICKAPLHIANNGSAISKTCTSNALPKYSFESIDGSPGYHQ